MYAEGEKPLDYSGVVLYKVKNVESHHIDFFYFLLSLQFELEANNQKYYLHIYLVVSHVEYFLHEYMIFLIISLEFISFKREEKYDCHCVFLVRVEKKGSCRLDTFPEITVLHQVRFDDAREKF